MVRVPDAASIAGAEWLNEAFGWRCGASTGTNLIGALILAREMHDAGRAGSIVTLLCDERDRYADTLFSPSWRADQGLDPVPWKEALPAGPWPAPIEIADPQR